MFGNTKENLAKDLATALTENAIPSYAAKREGDIVVELSRKSLHFRVDGDGNYIPVEGGSERDPISSAGEVYDYIRGW